MNITQMAKVFEKFTVDNSPLILTGIGVAGTITTAVLVGKASFKAADILRTDTEFAEESGFTLTPKEKITAVWPLYIPAVGVGVMTVTCVIVANRIGSKRAAAMAAAYTVSEKAFTEYRDKIVDKMGANKERAARDELAQDKVNNNPPTTKEVIITGGGNVLCLDAYTNRYFESDMETIKQAQNNLNYQLLGQDYASLNDFYDKIGLEHVGMGEEVGWVVGKPLEIEISTTMSKDSRPCLVISFNVEPTRNYYRSH